MTKTPQNQPTLPQAKLSQTAFFGDIVSAFASKMEAVFGLEDSAGFVAHIGAEIGQKISQDYNPENRKLSATEIARILMDLKAQIGGKFDVESIGDDKIVLVNSACPFGGREDGLPSLCMMTTSVFGTIAAQASGYAKVHIDEALATGHSRCRVMVHLQQSDTEPGHEFFEAV